MWISFALVFAITSSFGAILSKFILRKLDEYTFLFVSGIFTSATLFAACLLFFEIPRIDYLFITNISLAVFISVFASIFAYRAIKISDISLVTPLSAFNPVFTSILAFLFLGDNLEINGVIGILLVAFGAYLFNIRELKRGFLAPFTELFANAGVRLSLVAYFLWAITPIFEKSAILGTNPITPAFVSLVGSFISTLIFGLLVFLKKKKRDLKIIIANLKYFFVLGILGAIGQASAYTAFSLVNPGYATAVFKLSMIFTIIMGSVFLGERELKERIVGALVMLFGVIVLSLG